jgi:hypothetical protein
MSSLNPSGRVELTLDLMPDKVSTCHCLNRACSRNMLEELALDQVRPNNSLHNHSRSIPPMFCAPG